MSATGLRAELENLAAHVRMVLQFDCVPHADDLRNALGSTEAALAQAEPPPREPAFAREGNHVTLLTGAGGLPTIGRTARAEDAATHPLVHRLTELLDHALLRLPDGLDAGAVLAGELSPLKMAATLDVIRANLTEARALVAGLAAERDALPVEPSDAAVDAVAWWWWAAQPSRMHEFRPRARVLLERAYAAERAGAAGTGPALPDTPSELAIDAAQVLADAWAHNPTGPPYSRAILASWLRAAYAVDSVSWRGPTSIEAAAERGTLLPPEPVDPPAT